VRRVEGGSAPSRTERDRRLSESYPGDRRIGAVSWRPAGRDDRARPLPARPVLGPDLVSAGRVSRAVGRLEEEMALSWSGARGSVDCMSAVCSEVRTAFGSRGLSTGGARRPAARAAARCQAVGSGPGRSGVAPVGLPRVSPPEAMSSFAERGRGGSRSPDATWGEVPAVHRRAPPRGSLLGDSCLGGGRRLEFGRTRRWRSEATRRDGA